MIMETIVINVQALEHFDADFPMPEYKTLGAVGADLRACLGVGEKIVIKPGESFLVPTGLALEIPSGFEVQIRPRSGLSAKTTLFIPNSPGTIDWDYRGEIKVILGNWGQAEQVVEHGDRIAQMVVAKVAKANFVPAKTLTDSERGAGGFGSTGQN